MNNIYKFLFLSSFLCFLISIPLKHKKLSPISPNGNYRFKEENATLSETTEKSNNNSSNTTTTSTSNISISEEVILFFSLFFYNYFIFKFLLPLIIDNFKN